MDEPEIVATPVAPLSDSRIEEEHRPRDKRRLLANSGDYLPEAHRTQHETRIRRYMRRAAMEIEITRADDPYIFEEIA